MPSFCPKCYSDMYICQICGRDLCSKKHHIKYIKNKGNVCPTCYFKFKHYPKPKYKGILNNIHAVSRNVTKNGGI